LNIQPKDTAAPTAPAKRSSAAMGTRFRVQFVTFVFAMMADNIEHVISYCDVPEIHSPALAGFAIVPHWLPFLLFSVAAGALTDCSDPRRIIQCGMPLPSGVAWLGLFLHHRHSQMGRRWCCW
jgi:hypothetical protein